MVSYFGTEMTESGECDRVFEVSKNAQQTLESVGGAGGRSQRWVSARDEAVAMRRELPVKYVSACDTAPVMETESADGNRCI